MATRFQPTTDTTSEPTAGTKLAFPFRPPFRRTEPLAAQQILEAVRQQCHHGNAALVHASVFAAHDRAPW
ncbi:hypothetical protein ABZ826_30790 [Streptomyces sp. NPDC047515]|uniref:hypothetical protein n=1 Tax=Streptomyces sp. NPDC047515 TaxID=3155380 RepID=UPI0033DD0E84